MSTSTSLRRSHRRSSSSARERRRVARHIAAAERAATHADTSALPRSTQLARALLLQALAGYRAGGVFPKNHEWPWEMPAFIDHGGTRCAMAHLMEVGGAAPLVAEIAATRNYAYVRELADDPRVVSWLAAAGISVDEAAAIQPTYCAQAWSDCVCGSVRASPGAPADVVLEGVVVAGGIRVDAIFGTPPVLAVKVGDVVASSGTTLGDHVLVVLTKTHDGPFFVASVDAGLGAETSLPVVQASTMVIALAADGRPQRCNFEREATLPITKDKVVAALRSSQCSQELGKTDRGWTEKPPCGSGGCSASGGGVGDASVVVLLAVAGAIVVKRRVAALGR